jgi:hypothetical protein
MGNQGWSSRTKGFVLGGALVLAVGSFLPWVKASAGPFTATENGLDGDGVITLAMAIGIVLAALLIKRASTAVTTVLVLAVLAGAIAVYDWVDVSKQADDLAGNTPGVSAGIGIGIVVCVIGAAAAAAGALMARAESKASPPPDSGSGVS